MHIWYIGDVISKVCWSQSVFYYFTQFERLNQSWSCIHISCLFFLVRSLVLTTLVFILCSWLLMNSCVALFFGQSFWDISNDLMQIALYSAKVQCPISNSTQGGKYCVWFLLKLTFWDDTLIKANTLRWDNL